MNFKSDLKDSVLRLMTDLERAMEDFCLPRLESICNWIMGMTNLESRQPLLCPVYVRVRRVPRP
jgi:hypothetical protein